MTTSNDGKGIFVINCFRIVWTVGSNITPDKVYHIYLSFASLIQHMYTNSSSERISSEAVQLDFQQTEPTADGSKTYDASESQAGWGRVGQIYFAIDKHILEC